MLPYVLHINVGLQIPPAINSDISSTFDEYLHYMFSLIYIGADDENEKLQTYENIFIQFKTNHIYYSLKTLCVTFNQILICIW